MTDTFIIHHNPNNGRYRYAADPSDAVASSRALLSAGVGTWVAGNCRRLLKPGSLLLFKFGGARLQQQPGIYAAARVTTAPLEGAAGAWLFDFKPDSRITRHLLRFPVIGRDLARIAPRSFGASIQVVREKGRAVLVRHLGDRTMVGPRKAGAELTRGLSIQKEHLDRILAGTKTWEIRGKATAKRGPVALIQSGSGNVVGICDIVDVVGPLSLAELQRNARRAGFRADSLEYRTTYAWVLRNARRLPKPVPYRHPPGAVVWVRLDPAVTRRLNSERPHG